MLRKLKHFFDREQNILIHICASILAITFGMIFKISFTEWVLVLFCISFVISTELMNSSIELAVDNYTIKKNDLAKISKDVAAAAVLISAITSLIIGIYIFMPKIISILK